MKWGDITVNNIKISIVDDHSLFAEGLKTMLEVRRGSCDVSMFLTCSEALEEIPRIKPHLALIDINMPDMNGIELTRRLLEQMPTLRILNLSFDDSRQTVLDVIASGSLGYLLKACHFDDLLRGIESALQGNMVVGEQLTPYIIEELRNRIPQNNKPSPAFLDKISSREREVLEEVAKGMNNQAIAEKLFISEKTVKNHITNILEKLDISDRMHLIVFAIREGCGVDGQQV